MGEEKKTKQPPKNSVLLLLPACTAARLMLPVFGLLRLLIPSGAHLLRMKII